MATKKNERKNRLWNFEPISKIKWEEKIAKDLNGADYKSKLFWDSQEGFVAAPFYTKDDLLEVEHSSKETIIEKTRWTSCEPIYETQPDETNKAIKKALQKGSDAIYIQSKPSLKNGSLGGDMFGTQIHDQSDFDQIMHGIETADVEFTFDSGMATPAILAMMKNTSQEYTRPKFIFDPISYLAQHGRLPLPEDKLKEIVRELASQKNMKTLCTDGLFYHSAGATIVQEVGLALATASEYLSLASNDSRQNAPNSIFMRLAVGPLYFPEIAKFRAVRLLWDQLMNAYEFDNPPGLTVIAETSGRNKTLTDSHNNMIRTITESMSAVLGGIDQLMVHPYNTLESTPGEFSRRIARNVQHILREEAHFGKVADPSAGSYYIENLTSIIANNVWDYFRSIEREGGILQSLKNGSIQDAIQRSKNNAQEAVNKGKRVMVGTNYFANAEEDLPDTNHSTFYADSLKVTDHKIKMIEDSLISSIQNAIVDGATVGDVIESLLSPQKIQYQVLEETRMGSIFDEIRLRTKSLIDKTGVEPVVHLIPVGDLKWRNARATFSHNTLGCGGFKIDHPTGYRSIDHAAKTIEFSGGDLFVLCGSDKEYEHLVEPFCDAFSEKGICILAGNPADNEKRYRDAGMDLFIYKGMNIPETLLMIQNDLFEKEKDHETT